MGHNVSETYKTYAHVIDDLDQNDRKPAEEVIQAVRQDMAGTWTGVQRGTRQSKTTRKKTSARAKTVA